MHALLAVGVTILTATTPQPQPVLTATRPVTVTFVKAVTFEEAISTFARMSQLTIEIDGTVTDEVRRSSVNETPMTMREVTLEQAIGFLTAQKGLSYRVADDRTIVIFRRP